MTDPDFLAKVKGLTSDKAKASEMEHALRFHIRKNFDVFVEGQNVNNSTYSTHGRFPEQVLDVIDYGARYTVGFHFRM